MKWKTFWQYLLRSSILAPESRRTDGRFRDAKVTCKLCVKGLLLRGNQKEDKVCKELLKSVTKSIHILLTFSVSLLMHSTGSLLRMKGICCTALKEFYQACENWCSKMKKQADLFEFVLALSAKIFVNKERDNLENIKTRKSRCSLLCGFSRESNCAL